MSHLRESGVKPQMNLRLRQQVGLTATEARCTEDGVVNAIPTRAQIVTRKEFMKTLISGCSD